MPRSYSFYVVTNIVQINPSQVGRLQHGWGLHSDNHSEAVSLADFGKVGGESVGEVAATFLAELETVSLNVDRSELRRYVIIWQLEDPADKSLRAVQWITTGRMRLSRLAAITHPR